MKKETSKHSTNNFKRNHHIPYRSTTFSSFPFFKNLKTNYMGKQMLKGNKTLPHGLLSSLTKREYFAGLAMQGILANKFIIEYINTELGIDWNCMSKELITECSIELSDALIDELNKR